MEKKLVVDVNQHEIRVALMENDDLVEIFIEPRGQERLVGNIYKGRVENILPVMQAAFVDVGLSRNAFLYAGDISTEDSDLEFEEEDGEPKNVPEIQNLLKKGQEIMVQVLKQQGGTKGVRVTTHITLPGRNIVLMPTVDHIGVSRRITDEKERERLKGIISRQKPKGMGVIVRTAGANVSEDEFAHDIQFLYRMWERIKSKASYLMAPRMIHAEESLIFRTVRDIFTDDVDKFIINDNDYYQRVLTVVGITQPDMADRVEFYPNGDCIFEDFNIESKITKALQKKIWLKSGSYLVIDEAEALTAIDVNTGKYTGDRDLQETILKTNIEAAKEIAKQLRLRDIGGIIIIDFIDMEIEENRAKVVEELTAALKNDRTKTNVLGMTDLGLVEMTRKKLRRTLSAMVTATCPYCGGNGRVLSIPEMAMSLRREIAHIVRICEQDSFIAEVSTELAKYILAKNAAQEAILPKYTGKHFYLTENKFARWGEIKIEPVVDTRFLLKLGRDAESFF